MVQELKEKDRSGGSEAEVGIERIGMLGEVSSFP
jgi:hypothetical protein